MYLFVAAVAVNNGFGTVLFVFSTVCQFSEFIMIQFVCRAPF